MKEEIIHVSENDTLQGVPCGECRVPLKAGDEAVVCPRCKLAHHLACWIQRGGCARHGCRQVVSPELLPPKQEKPIQVPRTPPWVIAGAIVLAVALGVGLYFNARRAALQRESSAYVLVPSLEDEVHWTQILSAYNRTPAGSENPAVLIYTPYGIAGMDFEQKLLIMIAANDSPELVVLEAERLRDYAQNSALAPLNEFVAQLRAQGIELDPERLAAATLDGTVYGIPHPQRDAYLVIPRAPRNPGAAHNLFPYVVQALYEASGGADSDS